MLTTWEEDGGPFITLPLVYTENPLTKKHNLGIYRMQVYDAAVDRTALANSKRRRFPLLAKRNEWTSRCR